MNVERLSDCRDFPARKMDFASLRMKREGRCFATRQTGKTVNGDTRLGDDGKGIFVARER